MKIFLIDMAENLIIVRKINSTPSSKAKVIDQFLDIDEPKSKSPECQISGQEEGSGSRMSKNARPESKASLSKMWTKYVQQT